jgi:TetR/AcrR family transcriptional repressor of nem operon
MARPRNFEETDVLDKALNVFWCRGYEATSVQDLVAGLGLNRASLYGTYGDKAALFRQVLERYRDTAQCTTSALLDQARPARQLVRELLEGTVQESLADTQQRGCFMLNAGIELGPHDPAIARIVRDNQQFFEQKLSAVLERGQREGDVSSTHPPEALAAFVFAAVNGIKVLARSNPDAATLQHVVDVTVAALG